MHRGFFPRPSLNCDSEEGGGLEMGVYLELSRFFWCTYFISLWAHYYSYIQTIDSNDACLSNLPDEKINKVGNSKSQGNDASIMLKQSPCLTHQSKVIQQRSPVMVSITAPQLYLKINFQHLCFQFSFLLKLTMLSGFSAWAIWGVNMTSEK